MVCQRLVKDLAIREEGRLVMRERRVSCEEEGRMVVVAMTGFIWAGAQVVAVNTCERGRKGEGFAQAKL
jgi:hypothetical protein